jgi:hypothetical protein
MSDDIKKENQEEKEEISAHAQKLAIVKKVKDLSNPDSTWTITQEILQDVMAYYTVKDPDNIPKVPTLVQGLRTEIEVRYKDDPELKQLLLDSIPADKHVRVWIKKDGWQEAVWAKVRVDGLFTAEKRAKVIESLRLRAMDKSDVAAKIWLTLSGDYQEKVEMDNKSVDMYREINKILHNKKD